MKTRIKEIYDWTETRKRLLCEEMLNNRTNKTTREATKRHLSDLVLLSNSFKEIIEE